tara:strand:+ start:417 stop:2660 length:2244 start_codon:yes stop_codon:yes gene_type:complete
MPQTKSVAQQLLELSAALTIGIGLLFVSLNLSATYIYENNQNLFDLTNQTGTTNLNSGDDQLSAAFNLDDSFTFYGTSYDSARMATNGCLHFGLGTGNINYNNYCGDYTPDPLPQYTNTMFPLWTDLIRDSNSQMLAKNFNDKAVFGWYAMREYNRSGSDNSFEVVLWNNDTFEYRYGELDIIQHDVLIGEQGSTSQYYQYLFHDECNTGTTNVAGTCVNVDWNNSSSNTLLENGGSLYGVGSGNGADCSDPLNDASCSGYAAAYLNQQCGLNPLYDTACPSYWEAYDDQQCDEDPQYAPFCAGYRQQESVAYFVEEEFDYGYEEEHQHDEFFFEEEWYDEPINDYVVIDPMHDHGEPLMIMFDQPYEEEIIFFEEPIFEQLFLEETFEELPALEEEYLVFERLDEPLPFLNILPTDELITLYEFETIIREEIEHEHRHDEEREREDFEDLEELEEWFEEEMEQLAEADEIIEITESREELLAEAEEEGESEEEIEELIAEHEEEINEERSSVRISALDVVASTIQTARNSVSSSIGGSRATNRTASVASVTNSVSSSSGASISSTGGVSTTSSPSMSDQIASASVQTQQVLSMSSDMEVSSSTSTVTINIMPDLDGTPQVAMADVQVQDMQGEIDTAISGVMTVSEADQIADQIVAQNIAQQQEQAETEQEETGQYSDESTLVAYLGYVVGFDDYRNVQIPQQDTWYEPRSIYTGVMIDDNTEAFYGLAGASLTTLGDMINMQPNL